MEDPEAGPSTSDDGDEKELTPEGVRDDFRKVVRGLILLGVIGGVLIALLIAKLTGML